MSATETSISPVPERIEVPFSAFILIVPPAAFRSLNTNAPLSAFISSSPFSLT